MHEHTINTAAGAAAALAVITALDTLDGLLRDLAAEIHRDARLDEIGTELVHKCSVMICGCELFRGELDR